MVRDGGAMHGKPPNPQDRRTRAFYGRRRGRRLRRGLKNLLSDLLPRIEVALPPPGGRLDPRALFGPPPKDWPQDAPWPEAVGLEIGFGAGEHLAWQAERNPNCGFLGAEYFVNGVAGLLREVRVRRLGNIRIFQGDGRDLLDVLPERSLDRVFILFSDPWPKARHHKRRLIQDQSLDRLARAMKDGVELRLATDDMDYLRWMLERLIRHPEFEWLAQSSQDWRQRPSDWPPTRYEGKALSQGRRPIYLRFLRRPRLPEGGPGGGEKPC